MSAPIGTILGKNTVMTIYFVLIIAGSAIFYLSENNSKTGPLAVSTFIFLTGALDLIGLGSYGSLIGSAAILSAIYFISKTKYRMTRFPLLYNDLFAFDSNVFRDVFILHGRQVAIAVSIAILIIVSAIYVASSLTWDAGIPTAVMTLLAGGLGIYLFYARAYGDIHAWIADRAHISAFIAQMVHQRLMPARMREFLVSTPAPMAGLDTPPQHVATAPHIVLISHESTFPPSLYGFPEEEDVSAFFAGRQGYRPLITEVFGGQSIISSFACQTGVSSTIFGSNRPYATRYWVGRIKVSLAGFLRSHAYDTTSILSVEGGWMRLADFYRSIGFDRVIEPATYAATTNLDIYSSRDQVMFDGAANEIATRIAGGARRTYTLVETLGNHSPHTFRKYQDPRVDASMAWFSAECARLGLEPTDELVEYYGRLRATIDDYSALRERLARENPRESFLFVNIGDHQPMLVNRIAPNAHDKHYMTFLAVDTIRFDEAAVTSQPVPIFNVDLSVARYAGLPLNGFLQGKENLTAAHSPDKRFGVSTEDYSSLVQGLLASGMIVAD